MNIINIGPENINVFIKSTFLYNINIYSKINHISILLIYQMKHLGMLHLNLKVSV